MEGFEVRWEEANERHRSRGIKIGWSSLNETWAKIRFRSCGNVLYSHVLGNVFVCNLLAWDALLTESKVTFKNNLQFCSEKLLIHKWTPSSPSFYCGCASYWKDKRNSLKGSKKRESQFYLWRDWFACLRAEIPIRPVLGECVSMHCSASSSSHHHHHTHQHHPALTPSIARFICVSHYREWNVVPARCINSKVGKLACCTACSHSLI